MDTSKGSFMTRLNTINNLFDTTKSWCARYSYVGNGALSQVFDFSQLYINRVETYLEDSAFVFPISNVGKAKIISWGDNMVDHLIFSDHHGQFDICATNEAYLNLGLDNAPMTLDTMLAFSFNVYHQPDNWKILKYIAETDTSLFETSVADCRRGGFDVNGYYPKEITATDVSSKLYSIDDNIIRFESIINIQNFEVYTITGELIYNKPLSEKSFSLSNYNQGIYFFRMRFIDGSFETGKVLVIELNVFYWIQK